MFKKLFIVVVATIALCGCAASDDMTPVQVVNQVLRLMDNGITDKSAYTLDEFVTAPAAKSIVLQSAAVAQCRYRIEHDATSTTHAQVIVGRDCAGQRPAKLRFTLDRAHGEWNITSLAVVDV